MTTESAKVDPSFIEKQRQRLTELRLTLLQGAQRVEADESGVKREASGGAREYEDDAQKLDALEVEGNLVARALDRLTRVDRALTKIEEGTYGFSDVSGQPIARERLDTIPDAICTLDEEDAFERSSR
jgi:DnaK suppressor protein